MKYFFSVTIFNHFNYFILSSFNYSFLIKKKPEQICSGFGLKWFEYYFTIKNSERRF